MMIDLGEHGARMNYLAGRFGQVIGVTTTHRPKGKRRGQCGATIFFDVPEVRERFPGRPVWAVHSPRDAPLTLWPSIRCEQCGRHGWIHDGKWLPDE